MDDTKYQELKFIIAKTVHIVTYACWAVLSGWLHLPRPGCWQLLGFLALHAMATEFFQQFVGRSGSWGDVGLDLVGAALGMLLSWQWWFKAS